MRSCLLAAGWILVVAALSATTGSAAAAAAAAPDATRSDVAASIGRAVPHLLRRYHTAGAAVALVDHGQVVWTHGYGEADRAARTPVRPDTVFEVGSVSKTVSAWGVLRLAQEGKVDLDAPVGRYLHGWQLPPSRFDAGQVTVRRLLSHTAGTSVQGYDGYPVGSTRPTLEESLAGHGAPPVRLVDEPGARFQYSGGGYAVLQLLIQEVSEEPFADYMREHVLLPLGMTDSGYEWTADLQAHTASGYAAGMRRLPTRVFAAQAPDGLFTTAPDLGRFLAAAADGGRGVVAPAMIASALRPAPHTAQADTLSPRSAYGLGMFLEPAGRASVAYHPGVVPGWAALYVLRADRGEGVVVLTNTDTGIHVASGITCLWARSVIGGEPQYCRSVGRAATAAVATSGALAAGATGYLAWIGWGLARRRRRVAPSWARAPRAAVLAAVAGGWLVAWHTDAIPAHLWQDEIAPAWLLPPVFAWTSFAFVAACAALAVAAVTVGARSRAGTGSRWKRLAPPVVIAFVWTLAWHTDLGARLVLASPGLVPARAIPSLRALAWAVPAACAAWGVSRLSPWRTNTWPRPRFRSSPASPTSSRSSFPPAPGPSWSATSTSRRTRPGPRPRSPTRWRGCSTPGRAPERSSSPET